MAINKEKYLEILEELSGKAQLVAVSKTKPVEDILALYESGQRDFGENYVQELVDKQAQLPQDIRWHFIGHLQSNKVKYIAPFVHLIHGVESEKLLKEIDKQGARNQRVIPCLLQVHIAREETKFGLDLGELEGIMGSVQQWRQVEVRGLMGMASNTEQQEAVLAEFRGLKQAFDRWFPGPGSVLSMGMSGDYRLAIAAGSNLVRIGSLLFGARNYS